VTAGAGSVSGETVLQERSGPRRKHTGVASGSRVDKIARGVSDRSAQGSAHQVVEGEPDATLRRARFMRHRAGRTLLSQDDREHRQTAELEAALMSDELPENDREGRLAP
jgi:hypothetical protein